MKNLFIGREEEQSILTRGIQSSRAELVAMIGKRRIGKTFLVKSVYQDQIDFDITGIENASRKEQL